MTLAFAVGPTLPTRTRAWRSATSPRMNDTTSVVNKYYPIHEKNRAPVIKFDEEQGMSVAMPVIEAFTAIDKITEPLFNYQPDDEFVPNKPVPPSVISWPSGDGRGKECKGTKGYFSQPNLREYGPFPDFFKRSCDG